MTKEERRLYMIKYRVENKERIKDYRRGYYNKNRDLILEKSKEKYIHDKEDKKLYYKANKNKRKKYQIEYQDKNKEYVKSYQKKHGVEYRRVKRSEILARNAKRRADRLKATPKWAELGKIKIIYKKAKWLESLTGLKYHVDHIVPLKGKNVCGLHVWANLQILEESINLKKNNRHS